MMGRTTKRGLAILIVVLAVLGGCRSGLDTVPTHLRGVWKTEIPAYAGRVLELEERMITFGVGEGESQSYGIARVEFVRDEEKGVELYTIVYLSEEREEYRLSFFYEATDGGRIQFKHQQHLVWMKAEA